MTELPRRFWLRNCLWPPVPDVMKWHLHWGQLITLFHRWIHGCGNQTWSALMLERHYNHGHTCTHGKDKTQTQTVKQTGDVRGWQAREHPNTVNPLHGEKWEVSHKPFWCYQWINLQQITLECNVFFSNSHQQLVTALRGSAQILQQTEQCCATLGLHKLCVLQYASYWNANCPLCLHLCTEHQIVLYFISGTFSGLWVNRNKQSHDQFLYTSEPFTENSLHTPCSALWKLV